MKKSPAGLLTLIFLVSLLSSYSQVEIILRKSFADSIKDQVTISARYLVKFSHERPNSPSKDGDLHIAGWASGIGLPVVAEIMNAKLYPEAVSQVHINQESGTEVNITGVWRFWCEHAGSKELQEQGGDHPDMVNSNPPHAFEFHPVLKINEIDLTASLAPIDGYKYKDADDAFNRYSRAPCLIEDLDKKIKITTSGVGYNYAEFWIELADSALKASDGSFMRCRVMNKGKAILDSGMRMVFPKGSVAEVRLKDMKKGDVMHVLGIPRFDLSEIMSRVVQAKTDPSVLSRNLPVEMIIVAELPEK